MMRRLLIVLTLVPAGLARRAAPAGVSVGPARRIGAARRETERSSRAA